VIASPHEVHANFNAIDGISTRSAQVTLPHSLGQEKVFGTRADIAAELGVSRARMTQIMTLLRLDEDLQREVIAGLSPAETAVLVVRFDRRDSSRIAPHRPEPDADRRLERAN
jgi:hypothetical protein